MRARVLTLLVAAFAMAAFAFAPGAGAQGRQQVKACDGDGLVHETPTSFFPPNHRMRTVHLAFTLHENDGDSTQIEVVSITNDEQGHEKGRMESDNPDARGVGNTGTGLDAPGGHYAATRVHVRAERIGHDHNGRTYFITVRCTDEGNVSHVGPRVDTVTMTVKIPHSH